MSDLEFGARRNLGHLFPYSAHRPEREGHAPPRFGQAEALRFHRRVSFVFLSQLQTVDRPPTVKSLENQFLQADICASEVSATTIPRPFKPSPLPLSLSSTGIERGPAACWVSTIANDLVA